MNMALGGEAITAEELAQKWCKLFSRVYGVPDAMPHDYISHDGLTVAAFAAERADGDLFALGLHHPSASSVYGFSGIKPMYRRAKAVCKACLISDKGHVWAARPGWLLDSMRRPRRIGCMSECFGGFHVTLLLQRERCWQVVRSFVSHGLTSLKKGRSWDEVLSKLYRKPERGSQQFRDHVMGMLGAAFHLVAVGLRADARCDADREAAGKTRDAILSSYDRCAMDASALIETWCPILERYEKPQIGGGVQ